jgi:hypothetical protein
MQLGAISDASLAHRMIFNFKHNEGFQPPGHRPETEKEKRLFPVGWKGVLEGLFFIQSSMLLEHTPYMQGLSRRQWR